MACLSISTQIYIYIHKIECSCIYSENRVSPSLVIITLLNKFRKYMFFLLLLLGVLFKTPCIISKMHCHQSLKQGHLYYFLKHSLFWMHGFHELYAKISSIISAFTVEELLSNSAVVLPLLQLWQAV